MPEALLDIIPNQTAHNLRRPEVLLGTETLEDRFLARVDQNGETCSALFELYEGNVLHLHENYIVG
jgi:hypothetical protein